MVKSSNSSKPDPSKRKSVSPQKQNSTRKKGVRKIFSHPDPSDGAEKWNFRNEDKQPRHIRLKLPLGPVIQVHSTRMRSLVDNFIKNTSKVHTTFRGLLQGLDGGFQGDMDGVVLAHIEDETCMAALAVVPGNRWFIHDNDAEILVKLLDGTPWELTHPSKVEGETPVIQDILKHQYFKAREVEHIKECLHLELEDFKSPHGPGGRHRLAQEADLRRLEEYAEKYEAELGNRPPFDIEKMVMENRILLGVVEGTIASVAVRGSQTLDHVLIDGVYTFKPFRRRGLAKRLVAALARQASGRKQVASMIVGNQNEPMLALLNELGFLVTADYLVVTLKPKSN